jgi:hypothetical protein
LYKKGELMKRSDLKVGLIIPKNDHNVSLEVIHITEHSVIYCGHNPDYFEGMDTIIWFLKNRMIKPKIEITLYGYMYGRHFREVDSRFFASIYEVISERKVFI